MASRPQRRNFWQRRSAWYFFSRLLWVFSTCFGPVQGPRSSPESYPRTGIGEPCLGWKRSKARDGSGIYLLPMYSGKVVLQASRLNLRRSGLLRAHSEAEYGAGQDKSVGVSDLAEKHAHACLCRRENSEWWDPCCSNQRSA